MSLRDNCPRDEHHMYQGPVEQNGDITVVKQKMANLSQGRSPRLFQGRVWFVLNTVSRPKCVFSLVLLVPQTTIRTETITNENLRICSHSSSCNGKASQFPQTFFPGCLRNEYAGTHEPQQQATLTVTVMNVIHSKTPRSCNCNPRSHSNKN